MSKLKISWKQLKLYSRDKNNYNLIRKKIFSSPCHHTSKRVMCWRLACVFKDADGTNYDLLPACGNWPIGLSGCKKPLQGCKEMDPPGRVKPAPILQTFYLHLLAKHTINVPAESTWFGTQTKVATNHVVLHWAKIPVRISQRLCEICSYWQVCCDAVLTSSHGKNKVWQHRAAFNSAMQMAVECAGEDPRVFIKCSLKKIELWHKIPLREIIQ